ncbi:MAG: hypothetical protein JNG90_00070 [Planctomycetaceae bacterium]|nr:hypothetical protein [Planctomycetaceae bacterium]
MKRVGENATHSSSGAHPVAAQLLVDPPQSGPWNMAVDQALLEAAASAESIVVRCYQWSRPTLSLGYFQKLADRSQHRASASAALVRRASGGGAILHDHELTYSLAIPASHARGGPLAAAIRDTGLLYRAVHTSLIRVLGGLGVSARLCEAAEADAGRDQPFLCFERRSAGDVLCAGFKIAGSAQRRYRGAILQHGSILLQRSEAAPELPGIADLTGVELSAAGLAHLWLPDLSEALGLECRPVELDPALRLRAAEWEAGRFGATEWTALK